MSGGAGVWVFRDGVMQLLPAAGRSSRRKALVYLPTGQTMASLERRLAAHGWERYYENRSLVQLHRRDGGGDLIALLRDFARFRSTHMYDVVVKNRDLFRVVDHPN